MSRQCKFLLFALDIIKGRLLGRNIPLVIGLHLTNKCNFNCVYCYGVYYNNDKKDVDTVCVKRLVDELSTMGTRYLTLTGGEPLLRQDIGEIVDYVRSKGILCSMNTNASLVRRKIDVIKRLDSVTISLDSAEREANDKNRGKGAFDRIMDGVNCLKENGIPFDAVTVVTRNNIDTIEETLEFAKKTGFMTEFNMLQDQNSVDPLAKEITLDEVEIKEVLRTLIAAKKAGYPILYANSSREYALNWPLGFGRKIVYGDVPPGFRYIKCYMGAFMCHIDADGYVYPCIQLAGRFPALNYVEHGFKAAWENLKSKKCKTCYAVCYNEFNQVYGLKAGVWLNNVKNVLMKKI